MDLNISLKDEAKSFFLYSYFGIVSKDMYDELCKDEKKRKIPTYKDFVIAKCIDRAYLDLCRTIRFKPECKGEKNKKTRQENLTPAKDSLKDSINSLLNGEAKEAWHKDTCDKLIKNVLDKDFLENLTRTDDKNYTPVGFSYGHAQKWVNMTLKYLWLLGLVLPPLEASAHIPIDNYIIEATWKDCTVPLKSDDKDNEKDKDKGNFNTEKFYPWSTWDKTEYDNFRDSIIDRIPNDKVENPLLWENDLWIKTAAKHSIKEYLNQNNSDENCRAV